MSLGRLALLSRVLAHQQPQHVMLQKCLAPAASHFSTTGFRAKSESVRLIRGKTMDVAKLRGATIDESGDTETNLSALAQAEGQVAAVAEEDAAAALSADGSNPEFKLYPDEETLETLYNGVKFKDLPYVYVRCTRTNTRMSAYMADGTPLHYTTPVLNGFINAKKKTNVAAQATGLAMGQKLRTLNQRTVRVRVDGFNVGRIATLNGLTQAGLTIVSISDVTYIDWFWKKRAKKRKRE